MEFARVAEVFSKLEGQSSRLDISRDLGALFEEAPRGEVRAIVYLLQGIVKPAFEDVELGLAEALCVNALATVSGQSQKKVKASYRKTGDLGATAEALLAKREQHSLASSNLTVAKVHDNLLHIATASGTGSQTTKTRLLGELFSNGSPEEAKMVTRFVTGRLRLGVGEATIIDALSFAKAGNKSLRGELERAFNLSSDLGLVAETLYSKGMEAVRAVKAEPFHPIRPALAERLPDAAGIIKKMGECFAEGKYDGLRLQIHKSGSRVEIYSRRQEKTTAMFPDVVKAVREQVRAQEAIFEGEAISFDEATGTFKAFQETAKRKRKHGIKAKSEEIPLKVFAFDLLYADGRDYTPVAFKERRNALAGLVRGDGMIRLSQGKLVKDAAALEEFFGECVDAGLEGVMVKDFAAPYAAGARKFAWIKLKKSYSEGLADTLDVVVVGYYYGKGKRTEFGLGGLLTAVRAGRGYRTIAKIGTGFSEAQLAELSERLEKIKLPKKPDEVDSLIEPHAWVKPEIVVEVKADELSQSEVHTAAKSAGRGLALRFPRLVRVRYDKTPAEATTEEEALALYEKQKVR
ncbi:MAG: ATP-dependent DNA ligase [Candidatus Micrarchaeia archaeon]